MKKILIALLVLAFVYYGSKFWFIRGWFDGVEFMMRYNCEQWLEENNLPQKPHILGFEHCGWKIQYKWEESFKETFGTFP